MSYIQTLNGKHINFLNINPDDIVIEDIATALSNCCRFAGHLPEFYSVAQHSVLTSLIVSPEFALEALLHDAQEAYVCDIPSPLKRLLPDYRQIESYVESVIRKKFGLPEIMSEPVKYADLIMLATERQELDIHDGSEWPVLAGIPTTDLFTINPLRPGQAYGLFMKRFTELSEATCNA
ncbi:HD family hydrolase [Buttiauxella sp. WJP83]|uniref:HD family hydrolase n=1 Tax=Buttiauxella sp. WJP83 TaxID=2986951 RepID=UPI0022DDA753|nr:HD family hydrolase [Buttiauxella sp. WJP83]WBM69162.1 HD family hydrolase [Buttiauxella sp. WJP83]